MVKRVVLLMCALASGCNELNPSVLYRCEPTGGCLQAGFSCWSDGYCRPAVEPSDSGSGGGGATGGGGGETGGGGGATGGGIATGGGTATGGGGGSACTPCPATFCGYFDAGCGETYCGTCAAGTECGVARLNRCDVPHLCTQDGWCFENPLPQGNTIRGAWAASPREVYFVGDNGTALLWNGEHHSMVALPALAEGVDLLGVHGTSPTDVFIVGTHGTLLHFDGNTWSLEPVASSSTVSLRAVWARAGRETIVVGAGNNVLRRQLDAGWVDDLMSDGPFDLNDVSLGPDGQMYALGTYNLTPPRAVVIRERDGGSPQFWDRFSRPPLLRGNSMFISRDGGFFVAGVADAGANVGRVGLILQRNEDGGWTEVARVPDELRVLRGLGDDELVAAGDNGLFVHVADGGTRLARLGTSSWNAVAPLPTGPIVEGTFGQVAVFSVADSGLSSLSSGTTLRINALCGGSPSTLLAASQGSPGCTGALCTALSLERSTVGTTPTWVQVPHALPDTSEFTACAELLGFEWLTGDDTRYLVKIGPTWNQQNPATTGVPRSHSTGMWLESGVRGWITNDTQPPSFALPHVTRLSGPINNQVAAAVRYDGGGDLISAMGGGWALGQRGLAFTVLSDGGLEAAPRLGSADFNAVASINLTDGGSLTVAVGQGGTLYTLQGTTSFVTEGALSADLTAAWAGPGGEALAAGEDPFDGGVHAPRVFRRQGTSWVSLPLRGNQPLRAVWGSVASDGGLRVWLGGPGGLILRRDP